MADFDLLNAVTDGVKSVLGIDNDGDTVTVFFGESPRGKKDGLAHTAWETVRVTRSLDQMTGSFSISMSDKWDPKDGGVGNLVAGALKTGPKKGTWPFQVFTPVHIKLNDSSVIAGYIDKVDVSISNQERILSIQGRDKTGDLVDCAPLSGISLSVDQDPKTGAAILDKSLENIAKAYSKAYNINISVDPGVDTGEPFPKAAVREGETAFQFLERLAKLRGLLLLADEKGDLVITSRAGGDIGEQPEVKRTTSSKLIQQLKQAPNIKKNVVSNFNYNPNPFKKLADTALVQGENILEARASYDGSDRFRTYEVKGQQPGSEVIKKLQTVTPKARAFDRAVPRTRIKKIIANGAASISDCQKRANWEMIVRATKAVDVVIRVQGWQQQPGGRLWAVNELVTVKAPYIGLPNRQLLISGVTFEKSTDGTFTTLKLTRPDAYDPSKKELSVSADPAQELGHEVPGQDAIADFIKDNLGF